MPFPMQNSKPGKPGAPGAAAPDLFQQPALANAMMIGRTFTQMAPPGGARPAGAGGGPAYPAQRGEGFQTPPKQQNHADEPSLAPMGSLPVPENPGAVGWSSKPIASTTGKATGVTASPFSPKATGVTANPFRRNSGSQSGNY